MSTLKTYVANFRAYENLILPAESSKKYFFPVKKTLRKSRNEFNK